MRRVMRKLLGLEVIRYAGHLVDLDDYLASFPENTLSDKIGVIELNKHFLNIMPNSLVIKRMCRSLNVNIFHLKSVNMF